MSWFLPLKHQRKIIQSNAMQTVKCCWTLALESRDRNVKQKYKQIHIYCSNHRNILFRQKINLTILLLKYVYEVNVNSICYWSTWALPYICTYYASLTTHHYLFHNFNDQLKFERMDSEWHWFWMENGKQFFIFLACKQFSL